jgi:hypothetical protein
MQARTSRILKVGGAPALKNGKKQKMQNQAPQKSPDEQRKQKSRSPAAQRAKMHAHDGTSRILKAAGASVFCASTIGLHTASQHTASACV